MINLKNAFPAFRTRTFNFRFFYAGFEDKKKNKDQEGAILIWPLENPSINKLTKQYFANVQTDNNIVRFDNEATNIERNFLYASSALFNLNPSLSPVESIMKTKLLECAKLLDVSFNDIHKGILSLTLHNPGIGTYYLRNIIGSSRLSLSLLMNYTSTSNLFNMETSLKDRYKERDWFNVLMALFDEVSFASKNLSYKEHSTLINRFIIILSSLEVFNDLVIKSWKYVVSKEFKENNQRLVRVIEDFESYKKLCTPKELIIVRSTQLFALKEFLLNEYSQKYIIEDFSIDRNGFSMRRERNSEYENIDIDNRFTSLKESLTNDLQEIYTLKPSAQYDDKSFVEEEEEVALLLSKRLLNHTDDEELSSFLVSDDSMIPDFRKGDTLLLKETTIWDYEEYDHFGKIHLIQLNNNIIPRILTPSLGSDNLFTLTSISSAWPDQEIKKDDLKILGIVVTIVKNLE